MNNPCPHVWAWVRGAWRCVPVSTVRHLAPAVLASLIAAHPVPRQGCACEGSPPVPPAAARPSIAPYMPPVTTFGPQVPLAPPVPVYWPTVLHEPPVIGPMSPAPVPVPEPASIFILAGALGVLAALKIWNGRDKW